MTYNWYDTRASTWYEGYDPTQGTGKNQGSFVDLSTLTQGTADYTKALDAVTNNIIGLFEQKGITAAQAQASDDYKNLIAQAKAGDTKGAFQGAAAAVTSAADRGDLWGADASEGGDINKGKSFLEGIGADSTATIADLYESGFGRAGDAEGTAYWQSKLDGGMSIQEIANAFAKSEEANIRDVYHEQYGRDADLDGLAYWMTEGQETSWDEMSSDAHKAVSDSSQDFEKVITYQGEDLNNDGVISRDEKLDSAHNVSAETLVRDDYRDIMGQVSRGTDRENNPFFTDANSAEVGTAIEAIRNATTDAERDQAFRDFNASLNQRGMAMDAISQGDQDDYMAGSDLDGDGVISDNELSNDPTYMSRFATLDELQPYLDSNMSGQDIFNTVRDKKWAALTEERVKAADDYVPWRKDGVLTKEDAAKLLAKENLEGTWKKKSSLWRPTGTMPGDDTGGGGVSPDDWRPTPVKPDLPTPLPVDKKDINYMPNVSSDVQDTSGYGQAKTQFDQAVTAAAPDIRTAQGQAGQRFTGTSAKGVRMKRSKASRMGTIKGTKQLGREQQTQSLNI